VFYFYILGRRRCLLARLEDDDVAADLIFVIRDDLRYGTLDAALIFGVILPSLMELNRYVVIDEHFALLLTLH